ncbi:MAG: hypothetical protein EA367_14310 [Leptolyngbya sp. DLM2.Bin15]|nr:MAG: hypothetical protein EA367_14310 [Leptolyngbya sp. DLM2.Bin15]
MTDLPLSPSPSSNVSTPGQFDAVLGGAIAPASGAILGGLEGLIWRMKTLPADQQQLALPALLAYGEPGLGELVQWLRHERPSLQKAAYQLLRDRPESIARSAIEACCPWPWLEQLAVFSHAGGITAVAIHPHHPWMASGCRDGTVSLWDLQAGEPRWVIDTEGLINTLTILPEEHLLCVLVHGRSPSYWHLHHGQPVDVEPPMAPYSSGRTPAWSSTASGDRRDPMDQLAGQGWLDEAIAWQTVDSPPAQPQAVQSQAVQSPGANLKPRQIASVTLSDRRYLMSARKDTLRIWDLRVGREVMVLAGHTSLVTAVAVRSDRPWIVSGSEDRTVRLWGIP